MGRLRLAMLAGLVAAGAGALAIGQMTQSNDNARAWPGSGAPCPVVPAAAVARTLAEHGLGVRYRFAFEGAQYGRAFGDSACGFAPGKAGGTEPACRFTSPALLDVRTPRGEVWFLPGVGRSATLFQDPEGPLCLVVPTDAGAV